MMKNIFASIALAATLTSFAQEAKFNDGSRFDFFDKSGNRVSSVINAYPGACLLIADEGNQDGFNVTGAYGNEFFSMKKVPWGVENFDLDISTAIEEFTPENVNPQFLDNLTGATVGGFQILEDEQAIPMRAASADAGFEVNLKCGTNYKFYIDVPAGTSPYVQITPMYTMGMNQFLDQRVNMVLNYSNGSSSDNWLNYTRNNFDHSLKYPYSAFVADKDVPNRYWFYWTQDNQPVSIIVAAMKYGEPLLDKACRGVWESMYHPDTQNALQGIFGECQLMYFLAGGMDPDAYLPLFDDLDAWRDLLWNMNIDTGNYLVSGWAWNYPMMLIERSNYVLDILHLFKGACSDAAVENVRASMLTLRSHAYLRLLQFMAPRWEDSNNGAAKCAPLLTSFTIEGAPLASMNEIMDQCYQDLSEAIRIFEANGYVKKDLGAPDAAVAHGTLARLALLKKDWTTARTHAAAARNAHPLTTNAEYSAGFYTPTASWLWGNGKAFGYNNHSIALGCNGYQQQYMGLNRINLDLYNRMDQGDVRRTLFLTWDNAPSPASAKLWWFMSSNVISGNVASDKNSMFTDMLDNLLAGMHIKEDGSFLKNENARLPFGMQLKFWSSGFVANCGEYGEDKVAKAVFMRADEMLLIEAEAAAMLGQTAVAASLLKDLNTMRVGANYVPGADIIEEVRLARRIELWGEGFAWTDFKRWNLPMQNRAWVAGDDTSGNFGVSRTISTSHCNGWRIPIPQTALQYNDKINISELNYTGVSYNAPAAAPEQAPAAKELTPAAENVLKPFMPQTIIR